MCQPGFGRKRRPTVKDWPEDGGRGTGMSSTVSWGVRASGLAWREAAKKRERSQWKIGQV